MVTLPVHPATSQIKEVDTQLVTHQVIHQVTHQVETLLKVLEGEKSRTEVMEKLNLKDRMNFAFNYLQPALNEKLIEMTIPDKPRSNNQKYRLTEKGKEYVTGQ